MYIEPAQTGWLFSVYEGDVKEMGAAQRDGCSICIEMYVICQDMFDTAQDVMYNK